jgi:hypothetical protein
MYFDAMLERGSCAQTTASRRAELGRSPRTRSDSRLPLSSLSLFCPPQLLVQAQRTGAQPDPLRGPRAAGAAHGAGHVLRLRLRLRLLLVCVATVGRCARPRAAPALSDGLRPGGTRALRATGRRGAIAPPQATMRRSTAPPSTAERCSTVAARGRRGPLRSGRRGPLRSGRRSPRLARRVLPVRRLPEQRVGTAERAAARRGAAAAPTSTGAPPGASSTVSAAPLVTWTPSLLRREPDGRLAAERRVLRQLSRHLCYIFALFFRLSGVYPGIIFVIDCISYETSNAV